MSQRIILDTNIWISYFISRKFDEIARLILDNELNIFSCEELEAEVGDVLGRAKFKKLIQYDPIRYVDFLKNLTISIKIQRHFKGCPDAKDDFLFDLAIQAPAKYLVTGDKKLIGFKVQHLDILSFKEFKDMY